MKKIQVFGGGVDDRFALVDDADFNLLSDYHWMVLPIRDGGYAYAEIGPLYTGKGNRVRKKQETMHVFIMGHKDGHEIDHINRNGLDNRRENLRFVTRSENNFNGKIRKDSLTGIRGVSLTHLRHGDYWRPYIGVKGVRIELGVTKDKNEAIRRRKEAEQKYYGHLLCSQSVS